MKHKQIRIISIWLIAISWISVGCSQIDKLTQFSLDYDETFVIPSVIGLNLPFNIVTPSIKTNSTEIFEINDTRKNLVEEVLLEKLALNIIDPADADFSFLESIEIYISAEGLEEVLVAWRYDIEDSVGSTIILETSGDDLAPYIILDEFSLKFTTVIDKIILSDHTIEVQSSFFVDAKILGI
jgi:hypothetical protein